MQIGLGIHFHPVRQASARSGEGKELSLFGFLSALRVSSESHLYRDERVVSDFKIYVEKFRT